MKRFHSSRLSSHQVDDQRFCSLHLQFNASYHYHFTNFLINIFKAFFTTFGCLSFELANQSVRTVRGGVLKFYVRSATNVNSAQLTSCFSICQLKQNHENVAKKASKIDYCQGATFCITLELNDGVCCVTKY